MSIYIYNLVIEATRRCNMKCAHCLRGGVQRKDMNYTIMSDFLRQVDSIGWLTITGGEPTLNPSFFYDLRAALANNNVSVDSFYMATNGKFYKQEAIDAVNYLFDYAGSMDENYIEFSTDRFHNEWQDEYQMDKFENQIIYAKVGRKRDFGYENLINQGRAKVNSMGVRELDDVQFEIRRQEWDEDEIVIDEGEVYLNCDGKIINGCDWSYTEQKNHIYCDYLKFAEKVTKDAEKALHRNVG